MAERQAVDMAIDAASGWSLLTLEDNELLPAASDIKKVSADEYENGFVSLISVDLDEYSKKFGTKAVKKNLTIPAWLNTLAEKKNVNFSQVLQDALAEYLGLDQS